MISLSSVEVLLIKLLFKLLLQLLVSLILLSNHIILGFGDDFFGELFILKVLNSSRDLISPLNSIIDLLLLLEILLHLIMLVQLLQL